MWEKLEVGKFWRKGEKVTREKPSYPAKSRKIYD